jgi:hypothetical protein
VTNLVNLPENQKTGEIFGILRDKSRQNLVNPKFDKILLPSTASHVARRIPVTAKPFAAAHPAASTHQKKLPSHPPASLPSPAAFLTRPAGRLNHQQQKEERAPSLSS